MARGPTAGGALRIPAGPGALARACAAIVCRPPGAESAFCLAQGPIRPTRRRRLNCRLAAGTGDRKHA
eukprot:2156631-Lingulodinium_polyedra.AAC.1